jgi:GntR family transcriptional regulator/MocR family aminotransferase
MGEPDLSSFPRDAWVAATRRALQRMPDRELGYSGVRGSPALREALAEHLGRTRGAVARPDRTLIVSGLAQGLMLLGQVLLARGTTRVAVEDPGYHGHGLPLRAAGLEVVPVAVDGDGIDVTRAIAAGVGAIVVTPAHQAPTGVVLAPDRRTALLEWAQRTGGLIVEDDYDAEYRYDREPVGALQGRAPDHVLYAGSASKILAPALRLGWLVAPAQLQEPLLEAKALADNGTPLIEQAALAELVRSGELDRHLRRMRRRYRDRRDRLVAALQEHLPEGRIEGVAAGLNVLVWLPPDVDEAALIAAAAARGMLLHGLGDSRAYPSAGPPGLTLGYAAMPTASIGPAVAELAALVAGARRPDGARRDRGR